MLFIREGAAFNFVYIFFDAFLHLGIEVAIFFNELRSESFEHSQHVIDDQNLPITIDARSNADGGYGDGPLNFSGKRCRHAFQHH